VYARTKEKELLKQLRELGLSVSLVVTLPGLDTAQQADATLVARSSDTPFREFMLPREEKNRLNRLGINWHLSGGENVRFVFEAKSSIIAVSSREVRPRETAEIRIADTPPFRMRFSKPVPWEERPEGDVAIVEVELLPCQAKRQSFAANPSS